MKKSISIVLAIIMLLSTIPLTANAATIVDSGKCGDNVTWSLDSNGQLTITGYGYMYDSNSWLGTIPWNNYKSSIKTVIISFGVQTIFPSAFSGCTKLKNVTIPNSVTSIGDSAFSGCTSLESIIIPDSVTDLGKEAFFGCFSLTSVTIGNNVTSIGYDTFYSCTSLTSVIIGNSVTSIGEWAFGECRLLTNITLPDSITTIDYAAFYYCCAIENITIPANVTSIGNIAFYLCKSLKSFTVSNNNKYFSNDEHGTLFNKDKTELVCYPAGNLSTSCVIPDSVTNIGYHAFSYSLHLTSVTIPDSVTSIANGAFYRCDNLTDVYFNGSEEQWNKIEIGNDNDYLINATIHFKINTIASGTCGANINWTLDSEGTLTLSGNGNMYDYDLSSFPPWYSYREKISDIIFNGYITSIGDYAFVCCDNLLSITIPDSIENIGYAAFEECKNLTTVNIGKSVINIENLAFNSCPSIENIEIPASVRNIGLTAFFYCINLNKITVDEKNTFYSTDENGILFDKNKTVLLKCPSGNTQTSYTIPPSVITIQEGAFYHCKNIKTLTIPNSVKSISYNAFSSCNNLTDVYFNGFETQWNKIKFEYGNNSLINATIHFLEHTHSYTFVITTPTCTEKGYTTYTCECGDNYVTDYVDATGHSHTATVTTPATHLTEGLLTYTCTCGDSYTETIAKTTEHTYNAVVSAPTCTDEGHTTYTCACGDSYVDNITGLADHTDGDGDEFCDYCDEYLSSAEENNCSHMCHQSGFMGFIWKIIKFFWKLFGMNPICECGAYHY